jgi:hypothetical protein
MPLCYFLASQYDNTKPKKVKAETGPQKGTNRGFYLLETINN